jgi:hypothetical protein
VPPSSPCFSRSLVPIRRQRRLRFQYNNTQYHNTTAQTSHHILEMPAADCSWIDVAFPLPAQKKLNASVRDAIGTTAQHPGSLVTLANRRPPRRAPSSRPQIPEPLHRYWQLHHHAPGWRCRRRAHDQKTQTGHAGRLSHAADHSKAQC